MRRLLLLSGLLLLHGCAALQSSPPEATPPAPAAARPAEPPAPRPAALAVERQWLQSWFKGTPVRIEQRSSTAFDIEVPREYSFDAGRSEIKPPLAAVLDKLAQSLQRKPELRVERLAAPADTAAAPALAPQRAASVRQHLLASGVPPSRLAAPAAAPVAAVQLRVGLAAP